MGYDLGYVTEKQFFSDWQGLNLNFINALRKVVGIKGEAVKSMMRGEILQVRIPYNFAYDVFVNKSLPKYYALTGAGQKFRINDAINTTSLIGLRNIEFVDMNRKLNLGAPSQSIPSEFCFSGVDGSGDTKVDLFPVPSGAFTLLFDLTIPQAALTADGTSVKVLDYLVTQNAYARALMERGEDGGTSTSDAYVLYKGMLSDAIALESTRYPEDNFVAV